MQHTVTRRAKAVAALAGSGLLLLLVVWASGGSRSLSLLTSTYNPGPRGCKAFWVLMKERGVRLVRHCEESLPDAPRGSLMLICCPPRVQITDRQCEAVMDWVADGNTLMLITRDAEGKTTDSGKEAALYSAVGLIEVLNRTSSPEEGRPMRVSRMLAESRPEYAAHVQRLAVLGPPGLELRREPVWTPVVSGPDGPIAYRRPRGDGTILFCPFGSILENRFIGRADNAQLLVNIVEQHAPGGGLVFDEYHNGYSAGVGPLAVLGHAGFWICAAQFAVVAAAYLWAKLPRFGRPRPASRPPPRNVSEHIQAMARLYGRARAERYALEILLRRAGNGLTMPGTVGIPRRITGTRESSAIRFGRYLEDTEGRIGRREFLEAAQSLCQDRDASRD